MTDYGTQIKMIQGGHQSNLNKAKLINDQIQSIKQDLERYMDIRNGYLAEAVRSNELALPDGTTVQVENPDGVEWKCSVDILERHGILEDVLDFQRETLKVSVSKTALKAYFRDREGASEVTAEARFMDMAEPVPVEPTYKLYKPKGKAKKED